MKKKASWEQMVATRQSFVYVPSGPETAAFRRSPRLQLRMWHAKFGTTTLRSAYDKDHYTVQVKLPAKAAGLPSDDIFLGA